MGVNATWTAPRDWTTLEVLTSTNMDLYVSSNLLHLKTKNMARYTSNAAQVITAATITVVNFEDLNFDAESCVTVGAAWKFVAPYAATYFVAAAVLFQGSAGWVNGEIGQLSLYANGTLFSYLDYKDNIVTGATNYMHLVGCDMVPLAAAGELNVRVYQNGVGPTHPLEANTAYNYISIFRVN